MPKVTTLASGQINRSDQITIELVEADGRPPRVAIIWPPRSTVTTVAQLSEVLAAAVRILANASTELSRHIAQQKGMRS
jgi:hypothetical protein